MLRLKFWFLEEFKPLKRCLIELYGDSIDIELFDDMIILEMEDCY